MKAAFLAIAIASFVMSPHVSRALDFAPANAGFQGMYDSSCDTADIDHDGDLDVIMNGERMSQAWQKTYYAKVYRREADGSYTDLQSPLAALSNGPISFGDFNGDDYQDILLIGQPADGEPSSVKLYRYDGAYEFTEISANLPAWTNPKVAWGDMDNDGDDDVVMLGDEMPATLFLSNGNGTFTDAGLNLPVVNNGAVDIADQDGNSYNDIAITGEVKDGTTRTETLLYMNQGSLNFVPSVTADLPGVQNGSIHFGFFGNLPGWRSLALAGYSPNDGTGITRILVGSGTQGNLTVLDPQVPGLSSGSVDWIDFDSDGDQDLLLSGAGNEGRVRAFYSFSSASGFTLYPTSLPDPITGCTKVADFNGDSRPDVLLTGGYQDSFVFTADIYRNYTPPTVSGTVTYKGKPVVSATVRLEKADELWSQTAYTDLLGGFTFPLITNGQYVVTVTMSGMKFEPPARGFEVNFDNYSDLTFTATINDASLLPDLAAVKLASPASLKIGRSAKVRVTLKNRNKAATLPIGPFDVKVLVSPSPRSKKGRAIGTASVMMDVNSGQLEVPIEIKGKKFSRGAQYLTVIVDSRGVVPENNEHNNVFSKPVALK